MNASLVGSWAVACSVCSLLLLYRAVRSGAEGLRRVHTGTARRELADLFIFVEPRVVLVGSLGLAIVLGGAVALAGLPMLLAAIVMTVSLLAPRWTMKFLRQRRLRQIDAQLPEALGLLAGLLRAGQGLTPAVSHLAHHQRPPISQELELLLRKQRMGLSLDQALEEMHRRVPLPDVALLGTAVRVSRDLGGNLAETLQRLGDSMRDRRVLEAKIVSLTAQGRLQGLIVGLLPIVLIFALAYMEPASMSVLYREPLGWVALFTIAVLEAMGFLLIRRIVRIEV
ncbi:MAG: type II secretion system F family protein [Pseudomonadota bacterium]